MKKSAKYLGFLLLLVLVGVSAQDVPPDQGNPAFSQQELDQMLAPIALYPDDLLSQILMAATYPLEIVEAARWSGANSTLSGEEAFQAAESQNWDPSVKSLVAFPQVLQTLDQNLEWTERLGDAFLSQQSQVMDTIQELREKAQQFASLSSNPQISVTQSDGSIEIEPENPDMVYVPYYDPGIIYGSWPWPDYPPVTWEPWVDYGWTGGFAWGNGIVVADNFFFGSWDWHHHRVYTNNPQHSGSGHDWQHNPWHRHGVPYRNASLNQQFGRSAATSAPRMEFRGYEPQVTTRPVESGIAMPREPVRINRMPEARVPMEPRSVSRPFVEPRADAFENVGRGADARNFSARGNASFSGRIVAPGISPAPSRGPLHRGDN